jgi:hypothetical protein
MIPLFAACFLWLICPPADAQEGSGDFRDIQAFLESLPVYSDEAHPAETRDWLVHKPKRKAVICRGSDPADREVVLDNGLIRRVIRVQPNAATVAFDNLMTGEAMIRGVKPEALVELDNKSYEVGGLIGQEEYGYLRLEWLDKLTSNPDSFQIKGIKTGPIEARFGWKKKRYAADLPWPPPGVTVAFRYKPPAGKLPQVSIDIHYALYDGLPLISKWFTLHNKSDQPVRIDSFKSEILAMVEYESSVEEPPHWTFPNIHVDSDYACHGMTAKSACKTTFWEKDPQYASQVNYQRLSPVLLESRPPLGPDFKVEPGERFESFRTFELALDTTERERKGLAIRRMYRTLAPWVTENPILMHVRYADEASVKRAVNQCADVGFEMVIMTFGSGFNAENTDPEYMAEIKSLVDYAHSKGIELGGYSLLASRRISDEHDVIHPETGKCGGAIFGNSPCLCSEWGEGYFERITTFFETTGLDLLEHDGSYPGDVCASTEHPGHSGLNDSQWKQRQKIIDFYKWCRGQGIYLNVPDWYFLNGSNKTGMGYREVNWSLPRERQIILGRQNIYDGTWQKTPSMGWMFVPLVEYHGGGAAATLEPLSEHLDAYGAHLAQNFGCGVQACYRGPRLYDTDATRALVKEWVDLYRKYRHILDSDIIHVRRADGRHLDAMLHANPNLETKGFALVWNPLDKKVKENLKLPLYYTGLTDVAWVREKDGPPISLALDRSYHITVPVEIEPQTMTWYTIR